MPETEGNLWDKPPGSVALTLEAWSQGLVMGGLLIMTGITTANMRHGVRLHKLIWLELVIAWPDCFFIFLEPPTFGWYLSSSSTLMIISWQIHNVVAWIKCKPFLRREVSLFYISTVILAQGYWILEIYANFTYFNGINPYLFPKARPYEALCRDPWWIFTTVNLFWNIKKRYEFGYFELIRISPRFAIMLLSMCLSIMFIILDVLSVTSVMNLGGLNPFWKIAFVFKCFTDTIILDDFKTALDKLSLYRQNKIRASFSFSEQHDASSGPECTSKSRSQSMGPGGGDMDPDPCVEDRKILPLTSRDTTDTELGGTRPYVHVDAIERLSPTVSPRNTMDAKRRINSKEWWEVDYYS